MQRSLTRRLAAMLPLALITPIVLSSSASAHVKWFAPYHVAQQPIALHYVFVPAYGYLALASVLALLAGALVELSPIGQRLLVVMDRVTSPLERNTELLFRAGCAFFFVAIWSAGNIILTPELHSHWLAVGLIQLTIALGMLSRRTMPLSGIGIAALYGIAVWKYGIFHMADYPLFLGIAVYIALVGLQRDFFNISPLDILRWSAGVTLMWAALEKWAYPEWTYELFGQHPGLTAGFSPEFFMRAAGWVEFSLAFSLLWTPLVRRVGAILLTGMFVGAVFDFGKIDFIGHSLIVVALLAIIADSRRTSGVPRYAWLLPGSFSGAFCAVGAAYYGMHALIYGTTIFNGPPPEIGENGDSLGAQNARSFQTNPVHARKKWKLLRNTNKGVRSDTVPQSLYIGFPYDQSNASKHLDAPQMTASASTRDGMGYAFAYGIQSSPNLVRNADNIIDADSMFYNELGPWPIKAIMADQRKSGVAYFDLPCCGSKVATGVPAAAR